MLSLFRYNSSTFCVAFGGFYALQGAKQINKAPVFCPDDTCVGAVMILLEILKTKCLTRFRDLT